MTAAPLLSLVEADDAMSSISLAEILSALSFALDLTGDAVPGHSLRSCLLGMRIATEARLPAHQRSSLYYALLLKDVGCSSNASRMCSIVGGDDRAVKAGVKLEDWTRPHKPSLTTLSLLWHNVLPEAGSWRRALRIGRIALTQHSTTRELITMRCDRGAAIIGKLGFDATTAQAVRSLDEHWDGSGFPARARREEIPLLSRICLIAQHLDTFAHERGPEAAIDTLIARAGTWFDPELARLTVSLHGRRALWSNTLPEDDLDETRREVMDLDAGYDPHEGSRLTDERLNTICEAFADVVDAKSPFTFRHSMGVATAAHRIALEMGLPAERVQLVHRSALLHDLGKLGVPNSILDKPGQLTSNERVTVEAHPVKTRQILEQVRALRSMATIAGEHHEKLDGSGYPDRRVAEDLSLESRIVAVADIYSALAEDRPYRSGMAPERIRAILMAEAPHKIDPDCLDALFGALATTPSLAAAGVCAESAPAVPAADTAADRKPPTQPMREPLSPAAALHALTQNTLRL